MVLVLYTQLYSNLPALVVVLVMGLVPLVESACLRWCACFPHPCLPVLQRHPNYPAHSCHSQASAVWRTFVLYSFCVILLLMLLFDVGALVGRRGELHARELRLCLRTQHTGVQW